VAIRAGRPKNLALRRIHVLPSGGSGGSPRLPDDRLIDFASCVAPELLARVANSNVCGVTWGKTLGKAVEAVARLDPTPLRNGRRQFIATCGEPFSMEALESSSSHIAESLNNLQGGNGDNISTLRGIPAFIPQEFNRNQKIIQFIHGHTAFGRIFGKSPAERQKSAISELDTVITSVGMFEDPPTKFVKELMAVSGCDLADLKKLAHGDIGGVLIRRSDLTEGEAGDFARIADMWIGISSEDLKGVVARSAGTAQPGVVVLAIGANKADIVYEVVHRGLVSELFVDQDLAFGLAKLCGVDPNSKLSVP
jgi:DNA-binding transcriptional regulator LsrR (DeoR family)